MASFSFCIGSDPKELFWATFDTLALGGVGPDELPPPPLPPSLMLYGPSPSPSMARLGVVPSVKSNSQSNREKAEND